MTSLVAVLLFLVTAMMPASASAAGPCHDGEIVLDGGIESIRDLGGCIWYLEDPGQELTLDEVRALESGAFTRHEGGVLNFGYTESAYWVRLDLRSAGNPDQNGWILELALPLVDEVTLFMV
ncbi:MAG TPA: histidine kinase, partial [Marinobacter adhaerens]|nr:histidine kinase [Marinobacter adhaerens]